MVSKANGADTFVDELSKWATEKNLDIASVMTTAHPDGQFQRELLVWGVSDAGAAALERFIDIADSLQLKTWRGGELDDGKEGRRKTWQQGDLASSRKQVAPLLREAMKKIKAKA
jgi:exopolyphosphatase